MRTARVIRKGFTPSNEEMNDGLEALNMIIGSISAEYIIPNRTIEAITPSSSAASYTIGSGGDFNTARPILIENIYLQDANSVDYPLRQMDKAQYMRIIVKNVTTLPSRYFYNPSYTTGTIYFDSVLDHTTYTSVYIDSIKPLTQLATLTTTISLPDEYLGFFKDLLAIDLASEAGKQIDSIIVGRTEAFKRNLKKNTMMNNMPVLTTELTGGGRYDIYGDF